MSEYIPLEIQAEILKTLPLKPLIQFHTVSKSFKCLIDSPNFVESYYVHHSQPDHFILRYTLGWLTRYPGEERFLTLVDNDDSFVQQEFIPPVPDLIKTFNSSIVFGSSHGLLCFNKLYPDGHFSDNYDGTEMVVLWNPSIRKSIGIQAPYMYEKLDGNFYDFNVDNVIGFGVCPVTFDPTILKITCIAYKRKRNDMSHIRVPWKVGVFTLSTGTWSILSTKLPRKSIILGGFQVVIDRFIYWVALDMFDPEDGIDGEEVPSQSRFLIVSFDLTVKEFKEISLTGSLTNVRCNIQSISKLRESLVLLAYHFEEEIPACWCLWMMKEEGVSTLFTNLYTINLPDTSISQILGFRTSGEVIMETCHRSEKTTDVQIYEPNNEYAKNLEIDGIEYFSSFMCSYMETLLLLDKPDGHIYLPRVRI